MGKKRRALRNPQKFGAKRSYLVAHEDISDPLTETIAAIPIEMVALTEVETVVTEETLAPPKPKKSTTFKTKATKKTTSRTRKSSKTTTKKTK
jgi:hypothetical protein